MRIAAINDTFFHSTGQIMRDVASHAIAAGAEMTMFTSALERLAFSMPGHEYYGTPEEMLYHREAGRRTGLNGCFDEAGTRRLVQRLEELDVQLIHLHNIHGFSMHLPTLFDFVTRRDIPVVWTMHGCWPFTGNCTHYTAAGCGRWREGCGNCPQLERWPWSDRDETALLWEMKRQLFTGVPRLTMVGCSAWIAGEARKSFLSGCDIRTIFNGVNLNVFHPVDSDFRQRHGLEGKTILLGVADDWLRRKGLQSMIALADRLDERYQLVLAGTNERVEAMLPSRILPVRSMRDKSALAQLYSAADIFLQTSQEDNFPTVNVEALACGTPVITFDVGGCPDALDESCGRVVPAGDVDAMLAAIREQTATHAMTQEACLRRAAYFSTERMCAEYLALYQELLSGS